MIELSKLTRSFHDQTIDNVEVNGRNLLVTLSVVEIGKEYGYGAESEKADFSGQEEHFRRILITFYNVRNISKDFKYDFGDLDILGTEVSGDRFTFESYIDHNEPNLLSFESDGFDIVYLSDKLTK